MPGSRTGRRHAGLLPRSIAGAILCIPWLWGLQTAAQEQAGGRQGPAGANETTLAERLESIENVIERMRRDAGVPGAALAIIADNRVVLIKGFGVRDVDKKLPVTTDTMFPVGSVSKPFTALAVLLGIDDGVLSLDDAPRKFLPEFKLKDPDADIRATLRDLLAHRTGLERADLAWIAFKLTRTDLIKGVASLNQMAPIRASFNYNNYLYVVAGEVAARAERQTYEALVESRIFGPLGMRRSHVSIARFNADSDRAAGYTADITAPAPVQLLTTDSIAPAGGVVSTARDMGEFVRLLIAGGQHNGRTIVSSAQFKSMTTPQINIAGEVDYGLGLFLRKWNGLRVIDHGGNVFGYSALVAAIPEKGVGFALLTNASNSAMNEAAVRQAIWSRLLSPRLPAPVAAEARPPQQSQAAAGTDPASEAGPYAVPGGSDFVVVADRGKLTLKVPGQPDYPLIALGDRRYRLGGVAPSGFIATFRPARSDPTATELFLKQPHGDVVLPKRVAASLDAMSATYADAIGVYKTADGAQTTEIANISGNIAFIAAMQPAYALLPKGNDVFHLSDLEPVGGWVITLRRQQGRIAGFSLKQPHGTVEFASAGPVATSMSAGELHRRMVSALGGEAALAAKRTLVQEFEAEMQGAGLSGRGKFYWKAPFAMASEVALRVLGQEHQISIRSVFDGTKGQHIKSGEPPQPYKPGEVDWQHLGSVHEPLNWSRLYSDVTVAGRTQFDGKECYALRLTLRSGRVVTAYYDAATYLPAGASGLKSLGSSDKEIETVTLLRKWRTVDGVRLPFEQVEQQASVGLTTVVRVNSAAWNVPVSDDVFSLK
ncbi:MAG: serine hydrolase [Hyphomonadaceae bacterium]|nr:serine hydrolase [Hyphomonadaceae bacterium]